MTKEEILELLTLQGWTRNDLAVKLGLCRNSIDRWFVAKVAQRRHPSEEHVQLMRKWLTEARLGALKRLQVLVG